MTIWAAEIKELSKLFESLSGQFPYLEKELDRLVKAVDENMVLLYSRRCLEVIVTDLCECELGRPRKTEPLKGILDKLNKEEKVPSNIIASMHSLNSLSSFGAHPKDFDPEQVRPVLINLTTIIRWYLKYTKDQIISTKKPVVATSESCETAGTSEGTRKSKKRLIWLLTGFALVAAVIVALLLFDIIGDGKRIEEMEKSIAVLPFKNFSPDPDQEYMCMGLTDEIINHLYKIRSFDKVVSLSSALTYKESDKRIPEIASELKVNYILEGTYKKLGEQITVTAQLIEPKSDKHIWQNEYDQPYEEITAIQRDIALQIADHLKAFLTDSEKQYIQAIETTNQEAYELLQQAKYLGNIDLALQAIELDPDYSNAYSMVGVSLLYKGTIWGGREMQSIVWDAIPYLDKALELNQNNHEAHFGLAAINELIKWDYITAEREYIKAIELSPKHSEHIGTYTRFLIKRNQLEKALSYIEDTTESDSHQCIEIQILSGNNKEAYNLINTYLKLYGETVCKRAGEYYIWLEEYDSAKLYLESALQYGDPQMFNPRFQACLALVYHKTKNQQEAQAIIAGLINKSDTTLAGSPEYFTGWYYSGIGESDAAFYWLEEAYQNRSPEMPWLKVDPVFKNLKEDERYRDLYERTGHKAYDEYQLESNR